MRDKRKRQRAENKAALERIRAFPEFQQFSKAKQKDIEKIVLHSLADFDKILALKLKEVELYSAVAKGWTDDILPLWPFGEEKMHPGAVKYYKSVGLKVGTEAGGKWFGH